MTTEHEGCLGDYKAVWALDNIVGNDEVAANGQTVHELTIVSPRHVLGVNRPRHIFAGNLTIVGRICYAWVTPVLSVDKVGALEGFLLVVLHTGIAYELRIEFITLGVGDNQIDIGGGIHPLGK